MNRPSIVNDWGGDSKLRVLYIINVFTIKTIRLPIVESVLVGGMQVGVAC